MARADAPKSKKVTSTPRLEELGLRPHLTASTRPRRRLRNMGSIIRVLELACRIFLGRSRGRRSWEMEGARFFKPIPGARTTKVPAVRVVGARRSANGLGGSQNGISKPACPLSSAWSWRSTRTAPPLAFESATRSDRCDRESPGRKRSRCDRRRDVRGAPRTPRARSLRPAPRGRR